MYLLGMVWFVALCPTILPPVTIWPCRCFPFKNTKFLQLNSTNNNYVSYDVKNNSLAGLKQLSVSDVDPAVVNAVPACQ